MGSAVGEAIGTLSATDCDTHAPFNLLQYFISQNATNLIREYFDIRPNGEIYVRKSLILDTGEQLKISDQLCGLL